MLRDNNQYLLGLTRPEIKEILENQGLPAFAAKQIYDWIYRKFEYNVENWSNLSKKSRAFLSEGLPLGLPKIVWEGVSRDGTRKFLVKLADGNTVETVAIPSRDRLTLCVSSQVGCAIGCTFCHTGTQGLTRHLKAHEIVGQFMAVSKWIQDKVDPELRLTNIVYMGQGEPLHNFEAVKKSIEIMMDDHGLYLGQRKITVSTSGLVPQIKKLVDFPPVNFAISLHAAYDDVRTELMPINKVYDLKRLFTAIKSIPLKAHRRITYEYLLIDGLNDSARDVQALCELLNRAESKVNIIPFNEYPGSDFKRPSESKVNWFMGELNKRGMRTTVRTTKGHDILAACGQLKTQVETLNLWNPEKHQTSPGQPVHF